MTFVFAFSCFLTAFTPASVLFLQLVVKDPLRVILFVLGAFFWLVSLLATSLIWVILAKSIFPALIFSAIFQEVTRSIYFLLLYKAQGGLAKLASNGVGIRGIYLLHSSRHILALVCGLGMGVMAAIFLLLNIIADSSQDGVVGLPASIPNIPSNVRVNLFFEDASFPIFYSLSCSFLVFDHVCWTIALWDGIHKFIHKITPLWWPSMVFSLASHLLNTLVSYWLSENFPYVLIFLQGFLLATNCAFCFAIVKNRIFCFLPLTATS